MDQFIVGQEKQTYYTPTENEMANVFIKKAKIAMLARLEVLSYISSKPLWRP